MTPNEFVPNAIRTESKVEVIKANEFILNDVIDAIVNLSEVLDQIKKNAFYGKKFDENKIAVSLHTATWCIERVQRERIAHLLEKDTPDYLIEQKQDLKVNPRLFHAIIGIATESSELLEALRLDTSEFDRINILEELGDLNWYQAIAVDELHASFEEDVLDRVIAKLRARYPEKFTSENAINRDLVKERQVLEGKPYEQQILDNPDGPLYGTIDYTNPVKI